MIRNRINYSDSKNYYKYNIFMKTYSYLYKVYLVEKIMIVFYIVILL